jgi:hypothetical protein
VNTYFRIHWLSITAHISASSGHEVWKKLLEEYLGVPKLAPNSGRRLSSMYRAAGEALLFTNVLSLRNQQPSNFVAFELPGVACDALPPMRIQKLFNELGGIGRVNITRIDLAWDGAPFTPFDIKRAVEEGNVKSSARRKTLSLYTQPIEKRADGQKGTSSVSLGSNSSERRIAIYDRRGPVRLEFRARGKRANLIARDLLALPIDKWSSRATSHLLDYISFEKKGVLLPWWGKFIGSAYQSRSTVTNARRRDIERIRTWVLTQVAPSISLLVDKYGRGFLDEIYAEGLRNRKPHHERILNSADQIGANYE